MQTKETAPIKDVKILRSTYGTYHALQRNQDRYQHKKQSLQPKRNGPLYNFDNDLQMNSETV